MNIIRWKEMKLKYFSLVQKIQILIIVHKETVTVFVSILKLILNKSILREIKKKKCF